MHVGVRYRSSLEPVSCGINGPMVDQSLQLGQRQWNSVALKPQLLHRNLGSCSTMRRRIPYSVNSCDLSSCSRCCTTSSTSAKKPWLEGVLASSFNKAVMACSGDRKSTRLNSSHV